MPDKNELRKALVEKCPGQIDCEGQFCNRCYGIDAQLAAVLALIPDNKQTETTPPSWSEY